MSRYHTTEVRDERVRTVDRRCYRAVCRFCGWVGPARERRYDADDDGTAHEIAENGENGRP